MNPFEEPQTERGKWIASITLALTLQRLLDKEVPFVSDCKISLLLLTFSLGLAALRLPIWPVFQHFNVLTHPFLPPEQLIIYQVGILPSHFYNVLADKDYSGFRSLMGTAMVLILLNSMVNWCSSDCWYCPLIFHSRDHMRIKSHWLVFLLQPGIWSLSKVIGSPIF